MADAINANKTSTKYEAHPEGSYAARCVDVIDLGEKVTAFPGSPTKLLHKCALVFRTGEVNADGDPMDVSQEFTVSMHEKGKLRPFLERWRGKSYTEEQAEQGVPLEKMVGQVAFVTIEQKVSQKGRTYAALIGASPVVKGMNVPEFQPYTRAPYWEERKATYAQEADAYRKSVNAPRPTDDDLDSALPF